MPPHYLTCRGARVMVRKRGLRYAHLALLPGAVARNRLVLVPDAPTLPYARAPTLPLREHIFLPADGLTVVAFHLPALQNTRLVKCGSILPPAPAYWDHATISHAPSSFAHYRPPPNCGLVNWFYANIAHAARRLPPRHWCQLPTWATLTRCSPFTTTAHRCLNSAAFCLRCGWLLTIWAGSPAFRL